MTDQEVQLRLADLALITCSRGRSARPLGAGLAASLPHSELVLSHLVAHCTLWRSVPGWAMSCCR